MRVLGADLQRRPAGPESAGHTLVLLDPGGGVSQVDRVDSLPALAARVAERAGAERFLLGLNVPVVVPARPARSRPVENLVRRRLGLRMPPGGRSTLAEEPMAVAGETLLAGLAAGGRPCLPYFERGSRDASGLVETWPPLILKALLWEGSAFAAGVETGARPERFKAFNPPVYRARPGRGRAGWADRASSLDLIVRSVGDVEGFDLDSVRGALGRAADDGAVERAGALMDAVLVAGLARRYLESPESCAFVGDRENGYLILPADAFLRSVALGETGRPRGKLFPEASLRDRLGRHAQLRSPDLLEVPGRPQRLEATFREPPGYEFDNVDEMLWWKHCRHLSGPPLPTEGLLELWVVLGPDTGGTEPLRLARSRHRTLSFRFDPPATWRTHLPTRDGKTHRFRVERAVFQTLPDAR